MSYIADYLYGNPTITLFLCLAFGYLFGKLKIRSFTVGATAGSLIISLLIGVMINQFAVRNADAISGGQSMINGTVSGLFFALFCFTIGFEVGPAFFSSLKTTGIKIVILSFVFAAFGLGTALVLTKLCGLDKGTGAGLIAGALTQSAVLGVVDDDNATNAAIAYALTYVFGTIGVILFVKKIAPAILRKDLFCIAKEKIDSVSQNHISDKEDVTNQIIQVRAYRLEDFSPFCGCSVQNAEDRCASEIEIEAVYRDDRQININSELILKANDIIQVIGSIKALDLADNNGLNEVSDSKYFQVKITDAEIVLTEDFTEETEQLLSEYGVYLKNQKKAGKLRKHSIIQVTGSAKAIDKVARKIGYIKENGDSTDVCFMSFFAAIGLIIGAVSIRSFSLGSAAVLIVGMVIGWYYNKRPRFGFIPPSARWILKSTGLNLFIVATGLNISGKLIGALFGLGAKVILIIVLGILLTLIPHILSLLFGKYVLHIDDADLLGGLCGAGTCTAGLNALTEETNCSMFAIGYAPGCAVGNILLVVIGIVYLMI